MARRPARRTAYRAAAPRRAYSAGRRTGGRRNGGSRSGSGRKSVQQVVRLVIETAAPSGVARPEGIPQVEVPTKKAKF